MNIGVCRCNVDDSNDTSFILDKTNYFGLCKLMGASKRTLLCIPVIPAALQLWERIRKIEKLNIRLILVTEIENITRKRKI